MIEDKGHTAVFQFGTGGSGQVQSGNYVLDPSSWASGQRYGVYPWWTPVSYQIECFADAASIQTEEMVFLHEAGHALGDFGFSAKGEKMVPDQAMNWEWWYQARNGMPTRPRACH